MCPLSLSHLWRGGWGGGHHRCSRTSGAVHRNSSAGDSNRQLYGDPSTAHRTKTLQFYSIRMLHVARLFDFKKSNMWKYFLENCQAETRELLVQVNNIGKCYYPLSIILREQNFNQELQCLQCVSQWLYMYIYILPVMCSVQQTKQSKHFAP